MNKTTLTYTKAHNKNIREVNSEDRGKNKKKKGRYLEMKTQMTQLASRAKINIDENQVLNEMIKIQTTRLKKNRNSLKKYSSVNKTDRKEFETDLTLDNLDLITSNRNLRTEGKKLNLKYLKLKAYSKDNLDNLRRELNLLKDRQFIYQNAILEKNFFIHKLKKEVRNSYNLPFAREECREVMSGNLIKDEDEIIESLDAIQVELLALLKGFNKFSNIIKKLNKEKEKLLKEKNERINNLKNN